MAGPAGPAGPVTWGGAVYQPAVQPPYPAACPSFVEQCGPPACGPDGRFWVAAELLYWAGRGERLPAPGDDLAAGHRPRRRRRARPAGTQVVRGNETILNDLEPGFRLSAGLWLDDARTVGVDGSYWFVGRHGDDSAAGDRAGPAVVSRPFFNAATGRQDSELVALPGTLGGTVTTRSSTGVNGADANARFNLVCCCDGRLDLLVGYRYLHLSDSLTVTEDLTSVGVNGTTPAGTRFLVRDRFGVRNEFHGGQVGLDGELRRGRWFLGGSAKLALGDGYYAIDTQGSTTVTPPGGPTAVRQGGLLAQTSNIGRQTSDHFVAIPEVSVRAGAQVTERVRVFAGYSYLYWNQVARAGDQVDLRVNPTQIPPSVLNGAALPAPLGRETYYWLQGVSVGVELRF